MAEAKPDFSLKETNPNIGGSRVSGRQKLTSSFDLVEEMHFLFVRISRANRLPPSGNLAGPLVQVMIGNYKASTGPSPTLEWNQVFAFVKDRIQTMSVQISVMDGPRVVGKMSVNIPEIPSRYPPDSPLAPQWYPMLDENGNTGNGDVMLSIWFGSQADEEFSRAWFADAAAVSGPNIINTHPKVYVAPRLWYLRVNVIQAQDLVAREERQEPKLYIKVTLRDNKTRVSLALKTKVSPSKTLNPTWNEDLMFVVADPSDYSLFISVMNIFEDKMEECLGKCEVSVSKVDKRMLPIPAAPLWYNLERPGIPQPGGNAGVNFASKLNMRISLDGGYHVFDEPKHYCSDYKTPGKLLWTPKLGVLELGILSATGLQPMKARGGIGASTDAYCVAKYDNKWVRTRTVVNSLAPKWNEQYNWDVFDPCTVLTIGVFDNCHLLDGEIGNDARLGKVRIRLSTLWTNRVYTLSYPLVALHPGGVKKMGEIQLAVRFTSSSMLNLCAVYSQPILPKMHYVFPLSVLQAKMLRQQAIDVLCVRLGGGYEAPLRREVVEYMLDAGSQQWSMRRAKANFERLSGALSGLKRAWQFFDNVRKWKNPRTTILVHLIYVIVVVYPVLIFPTLCLCCFVVGLWRFRHRPRRPPHVDIKLSMADSANADELDEEFDTFPSTRQGEVLRMRYDRLRAIMVNLTQLGEDLATQLERIHSLLSWRDPRATAMFLAFCLVSGTGFYFVICLHPCGPTLLNVLLGLFVMRHPRLRIDIPSVPQNFFRRLPTQADCML